tara:strand:- start:357 stop:968 length:612 start_codon:yes stop_codon:yes gene_type:complete
MTITNFGTLKTAIADTLNRDDLTSVIPQFVSLAQAQFNRKIRSHRQITRGSLTINTQFEALPADWLETIRITMDANPIRVLTQISMDDLTRYRTAIDNTTDAPVYFSHNGTDIELFPTPSTSYTGEITYYAKITALSADGDTNWLLTNNPDVYLYGSLVHTAPYLKDDARIALWAGLLAQAMDEIEDETAAARFGSPLRMRMR